MNLNERLEYERQFIKNNKILIVGDDSSKNLIDRIDYTFENYEKFLIVYIQEIFRSKKIITYIHKKVKETNKEVLISSATTTDDFLFTHPITNLYFWQGLFSKSKLSWNSPSILQFDKKYYTNESKQIKGILSVRKQNEERDVLFSDIKEFDGIFRYISFPAYIGDESNEIINSTSHFPNWKNLIKEYTQSYISFIIESMNGYVYNQLSEKTIIGFLTKTMPIVYGGKDYVKELKQMGFYVWNDEFNFGKGDEFERGSIEKNKNYINTIEYYNKLSLEDIEKLYNENLDKIEHNYNLAKIVMENDDWWNYNILDNVK
jgi:hypothetical protein